MMSESIRVLIADDQHRARKGLRALMATWPELEVVGEAADGLEAIRLAEALHPDVILMDVRVPGLDGIEATKRIKRAWPEIKVIVLTMYEVHRAEALEAGAEAFLLKGGKPDQLITTIRELIVGGR